MTTDDAIVRAGWLPCEQCTEPAHPVTAAWLTEVTILVTYEPGCAHADPLCVVVDTTAMDRSGRCVAITRAGARCRNRHRAGGMWCANHDPSRAGRPGHTRRTPDHWSGGGRDGR